MMALFNKEKILEAYVEEERQEAAEAARKEVAKEAAEATRKIAINLHNMGMKEDMIAQAVNVSIDLVRQWLEAVTA